MTRHSTTDRFTKGGQIFSHRMRMLIQNLMLLVKVWMGSYVFFFGVQWVLFSLKLDHLKLFGVYLLSKLKIGLWPFWKPFLRQLDEFFYAFFNHSVFPMAYKSFKALRSEAFVFGYKLKMPSYLFVKNAFVNKSLEDVFQVHFWSLILAFGMVLLMLLRFRWIAQKVEDKRIVKGTELISGPKLKRLLTFKCLTSPIKIGDACFQRHTEMQHLLLLGATGTGKSTALHQLIPQIRSQKNRALIIDLKGDMIGQHYDLDKDILLNPFDDRSHNWDIWKEGNDDVTLDMLANYLFPADNFKSDPFWEKSAGLLFKSTAKYLGEKDYRSMKELSYLMSCIEPPESFIEYLKKEGSDAYSSQAVEKTILNIKMMMKLVADKLKHFKPKKNTQSFSFKKWISEDKQDRQFVFLTVGPNQKETMLPFIQFWLTWSMAQLEGLQEVKAHSPTPRLWFILDELPALRKIYQLEHGLAFMRSYGGCMVAGMQNIYQLQEIYGYANARAMLTNFSTKLCFRLGDDPDTRNYVSSFFGEKQSIETNENFSIGSHQMRDGVNINAHKNTESIVDKHELNNLKQTKRYVEGILKVPGNFPPAKIKVRFSKFRDPLPRYIPLDEKKLQPEPEGERPMKKTKITKRSPEDRGRNNATRLIEKKKGHEEIEK